MTSIPSTVPRDTVTSRDVATKGEFLEIKNYDGKCLFVSLAIHRVPDFTSATMTRLLRPSPQTTHGNLREASHPW